MRSQVHVADRADPVTLLEEQNVTREPDLARKRAGEEEKLAVRAGKRAEKTAGKAHTRDSMQALSKLGELVDGSYRWHGERVVQDSG